MKGVSSVDQTRKELSRGHGLADDSKGHRGDALVEVKFLSTETTPEVGMVSLLKPLFNCMLIYCVRCACVAAQVQVQKLSSLLPHAGAWDHIQLVRFTH